jgi:non-ribosomal peptide synthetase component F
MADTGFGEPARAYWRRTLAGAAPLDLPLVAPRTRWATGHSGSARAELAGSDADALAELARSVETTLFGALLAAAAALLGRLAGSTDVTLGTVAGGRERPEFRPLIGLFLNPLPLRLSLDGDPSGRALIAAAGRTVRGALAHSDVPFERIVADANPERRPYRQPLFDAVINHQPPMPQPRLGEVALSHLRDPGAPVTPYELMIRTIVRADSLSVQIDYQRERFADDAVASWLGSYVELLRRFIAAPDRRLSQSDGR